MSTSVARNEYLDQVVARQQQVAMDLCARPAGKLFRSRAGGAAADDAGMDEPAQPFAAGAVASSPVDVRIHGFWRWKTVVVPPNAYVVHTRRGHADPLHLGLGVSFRYDPVRDSYLVVPAAMQTLLINANCICRERQGVLVQGYVQWIVEDFKTAYRKLDFSDTLDPMRVVNVQLREQAEAAIKDMVATMGIDDVLSDKQPIITELTARLRRLAEGDGNDTGLGLRIVTVQIKEAVVSSPSVWEMLQRPFRSERSREARLAELTHQAVVHARESEAEKAAAARRIEQEAEVSRLEAEAEALRFDRVQSERARRARAEAETLRGTMAHEKEKAGLESELARLRLEQQLIEEGMKAEARNRQAEKEIELSGARRKVENDLTPEAVQMRLIQAFPEIAAKLPQPKELKSIQVGGTDALVGLVGGLLGLLKPEGIGH